MKDSSKKVLIIEGVPKNQRMNEGFILAEFLKMIFWKTPNVIQYKRVYSKTQFINFLKNKRDLKEFEYIHISAHGSPHSYSLTLPNGNMAFTDFRVEGFAGKTVTLSSCGMGFKDFAAMFCYYTDAKFLIAPVNEVSFDDAAIFYINFYHQALAHNHMPKKSFDNCKKNLENQVQGGFKYFVGIEMCKYVEKTYFN